MWPWPRRTVTGSPLIGMLAGVKVVLVGEADGFELPGAAGVGFFEAVDQGAALDRGAAADRVDPGIGDSEPGRHLEAEGDLVAGLPAAVDPPQGPGLQPSPVGGLCLSVAVRAAAGGEVAVGVVAPGGDPQRDLEGRGPGVVNPDGDLAVVGVAGLDGEPGLVPVEGDIEVGGGVLPDLDAAGGGGGEVVVQRGQGPHDIRRAAGDLIPAGAGRAAPAVLGVLAAGPDLERVDVEIGAPIQGRRRRRRR